MSSIVRLRLDSAALQHSETRFRKIFEHSNDAIFILDPCKDRILDANPMASHLLGYPHRELLKCPISRIHPDEMPRLCAFAEAVFSRGQGWTDELHCLSKTGLAIAVEISASVIDTDAGVCIIAMVRSIAERKRLEHELRQAQAELEQKVKDRTAELVSANALLNQALAEVKQLKERLQAENCYLQEALHDHGGFTTIVGRSAAIQRVLGQIEQVAPTEASVLITGESGTGKELVARAIHERSQRHARPLIKVNCAAIPRELFESEFFGHIKGAYTSAHTNRAGRFELAEGGTLFLDEVGEIPLELQSKLLGVLQDGYFERVGDSKPRRSDVRIIAATNRDLQKDIAAGQFRRDLYYRLNVFPIEMAPLRQRREDIPPLAYHLLDLAASKLKRHGLRLTESNLAQLQRYDWPGNIRELQNLIERAVILTGPGQPLHFAVPEPGVEWASPDLPLGAQDESPVILTDVACRERYRHNICAALSKAGGKIAGPGGAAELLGIKPTTLRSRIKALEVHTDTLVHANTRNSGVGIDTNSLSFE